MVRGCLALLQAWKAASGEAWEVQTSVYHSHEIRSLQFVYSGSRAKPITATPAPVNSGIVQESLYSATAEHPPPSSVGLGAGGPSTASAAGGDAAMHSLELRDPYQPHTLKEAIVSVSGVTPVHTYSRLISIASDGRMAVFDVYTGIVPLTSALAWPYWLVLQRSCCFK